MTPEGNERSATETSWSLVRSAARGDEAGRAEFAHRYEPVVRAYFEARWSRCALSAEVDDAVQETFLDCFRERGALTRVDPADPQRFRAFLYGVTRVVARRFERTRALRLRREPHDEQAVEAAPALQESFVRTFDRAWAQALLRRASRLQSERAVAAGEAASRRFQLLALRFGDGLSIRGIAERWAVDAAWLHHQYAQAREEFKDALFEVVRQDHGPHGVEGRCARLLELVA